MAKLKNVDLDDLFQIYEVVRLETICCDSKLMLQFLGETSLSFKCSPDITTPAYINLAILKNQANNSCCLVLVHKDNQFSIEYEDGKASQDYLSVTLVKEVVITNAMLKRLDLTMTMIVKQIKEAVNSDVEKEVVIKSPFRGFTKLDSIILQVLTTTDKTTIDDSYECDFKLTPGAAKLREHELMVVYNRYVIEDF